MKISWYGHSCFRIDSAGGSLVLDPYSDGSVPGLELPALTADAVLCSHGHSDHAGTEKVALSGRAYGGRVETLDCFHDGEGGAKRGANAVRIVSDEGLRVVHLGDLGHELSEEQYAAIGSPDVLLIPVGGFFTIDAAQAWEAGEERLRERRKQAWERRKERLLWPLTLALMAALPLLCRALGLGELYALAVNLVFLVTGFLLGNWHPGWLLYLTIPFYYTVLCPP